MTAPVAPVTEADMALFEDLRGHAFSCESEGDISFDALPVIAAFRTAAEAASASEVAELRGALEKAADRIERAAYIMSDERLTKLSEVFFRHSDEARALLARAKPADEQGVGRG